MVEVGDFIEYDCKKGYILNGGNLCRVCFLLGKFMGEFLNCIGMYICSLCNFNNILY